MTEEIHDEEYVVNILSDFFRLNNEYSHLFNTD